jgi:hypothetical protein
MAALAPTAALPYPSERGNDFYPTRNQQVLQKSFVLTLTGQGTETNAIPASALGFGTLFGAFGLWDAQNSIGYGTVIDPVNNNLVLCNVSTGAPVDVTSTAAYVTVIGSPVPISGYH